jgi:thiosulfate/3-mercaptopyruvate sulfurtransferase
MSWINMKTAQRFSTTKGGCAMRNVYSFMVTLLMTALLTTLLAGCGGNGGGETQPAPVQTGDTTLFPNKELLTAPTDVIAPQTIVLDARRSVSEYNAGHIPGAIFAPPSLFERDGTLLLPDELALILGNLGVTRTSKIIIYDNTSASRGAAGRLFWILEYLGCPDVTVLNGGWDQWQAQDMNWATEPTTLPAAVFTPAINPTVKYVTKEYVAEHFLPAPGAGFILIDVRTDEEYQGTLLNSTDPRLGHIPNAISFPYSKCFNADKTILNFKDLKLLLEAQGIAVDKEMVAYSTVGHRSGFFYFLCRLMGYPNMANYTGSIVDWGKADPTVYPMKLGSTP